MIKMSALLCLSLLIKRFLVLTFVFCPLCVCEELKLSGSDCCVCLFVHFVQTRAEKHFLLAGNFNKAVSGGFASPFGAGGGLEDSLMEGDDSAYPSGF